MQRNTVWIDYTGKSTTKLKTKVDMHNSHQICDKGFKEIWNEIVFNLRKFNKYFNVRHVYLYYDKIFVFLRCMHTCTWNEVGYIFALFLAQEKYEKQKLQTLKHEWIIASANCFRQVFK